VRFVFEGRFFTAVVRKPSISVFTAANVFPQYSVFSFHPKGQRVDAGETYHAGDLTFSLGVREFDAGCGADAFGINFVPGTFSSVISLDEEAV
jgi:hypothetical protein